MIAEGHGWSQSVRRDNWSPAYGHRERASVVNFAALVELPADFATVLISNEKHQADLGHLVRISGSASGSVSAYRYSNPLQEHYFFFADQPGPWTLGAWASDADFLAWSFDREKGQYTLVLCHGSYADTGGRRVLTCGRRVSYAEVLSSTMKVDIWSSDPEHVVLLQPLDRAWAEGKLIVPDNDPKGMGV